MLKITLFRISRTGGKDLNKEIQWFSQSLGLLGERDKEKSCYRVFIELMKCAKVKYMISSDELAFRCNLSRGTVVHHLNHLIEKGLISKEGQRYILRVNNLNLLIKELKKDTERIIDDLDEVAKNIDSAFGLDGEDNFIVK